MPTRSAAAAAQVQVSTLASPPRATEDVAAAAAPAALDPPAAPRADDGDDEACGEDFEAAAAVTSEPVTQSQPLQIGSRVSVQAKCFDTKHGEQWSTKVFGDGGTQTRVYGLVRELWSNAGGWGTTYLCTALSFDSAFECAVSPRLLDLVTVQHLIVLSTAEP